MNPSQMRHLKPCFGKATRFYKGKLNECLTCQFQRKCFLKVKGIAEPEKVSPQASQGTLELNKSEDGL